MRNARSGPGAFIADGDGVRLFVRVTPRARRSEFAGTIVDGEGGERLAVRLAAPPVEGAANQALVAFLAEQLAVPRSAVEIVAGETSRLKTVHITALAPEAFAGRLAAASRRG